MSNVSTLITNLKTQLQSNLSGYKELSHVFDLTKNTYKGNEKRFGVIPKSSSEVSGNLRQVTVSQEFEVILTDNYVINNGDSSLQTTVQTQQDKAFELYKVFVNSKCGSPVICINVNQFNQSESEILDSEKIVIQKFSFQVQYRINL